MNELSRFLRSNMVNDRHRFCMPGHSGNSFLNDIISAKNDITEMFGADNLYFSNGIIKSVEDKISRLYGCRSYVCAGGTTLSIQAVVWLLKHKKFVAFRGAHISFYNVCAVLGIDPILIGTTRTVSVSEIEEGLLKAGKGSVLFITSPNYYGEVLDIVGIKNICKKNEAVLVVDGAHGAHLNFTNDMKHPIRLGADICCDSFHKTLPALTGAAVIHVNNEQFNKNVVKASLAIFGSTSPSYIILDSLGLCADWLAEFGFKSFKKLENIKNDIIKNSKLKFLKTDPAKLTLCCSNIKIGAFEVVKILREHNIEPEFYNAEYICFILTPFLSEASFFALKEALKKLEQFLFCGTKKIYEKMEYVKVLSFKEALYCEKQLVVVEKAKGRVCGNPIFSEIPGVPLLAYGEKITEKVVEKLKERKTEKIDVI